MKKLIVSVKPVEVAMVELSKRLKAIDDVLIHKTSKKKLTPHYEISFSSTKTFKRFSSNLDLLKTINIQKPQSIYELAKILGKDVGNTNKLVNFFVDWGALILEEHDVNGRIVKKPVVAFQKIEFDFAS